MLTFVLMLAAASTPGAGVIDSQRADELMMPYQACMRRNRYSWFLIELERCDAHQDSDAYKACAEAASQRLQDRTPTTHDECKPLIPTPDEALSNLAWSPAPEGAADHSPGFKITQPAGQSSRISSGKHDCTCRVRPWRISSR